MPGIHWPLFWLEKDLLLVVSRYQQVEDSQRFAGLFWLIQAVHWILGFSPTENGMAFLPPKPSLWGNPHPVHSFSAWLPQDSCKATTLVHIHHQTSIEIPDQEVFGSQNSYLVNFYLNIPMETSDKKLHQISKTILKQAFQALLTSWRASNSWMRHILNAAQCCSFFIFFHLHNEKNLVV